MPVYRHYILVGFVVLAVNACEKKIYIIKELKRLQLERDIIRKEYY